ncbi:MAG: hypothetical protein ABI321_21985 [Polyangia bacterium]
MIRTGLVVLSLSFPSLALAVDAAALHAPAPAIAPANDGVRTRLTVLAFNTNGTAVLARARVEGGVPLDAYEVWSTTAPVRERYDIPAPTSKLAPAEPTSCESRLGFLEASLKQHGFAGVSVHKGACHKHEAVVVVDKKHTPDLKAAQFKALGTKLVRDGYEIRFRSSTISIYKDEALLCTLEQAKREAPAEIRVNATPGTKLVYVTEETSIGDQGLVGMCGGTPLVPLK